MKNIFIKALVAASILTAGLCVTGCGSEEVEVTEVTNVAEQTAESVEFVEPEHGVIYYVDAEVTCTEVFDGITTVVCRDAHGNNYAFRGEGFEVGSKVCLEMDDNMTENDIADDIICNVLVY